MKDLSTLAFIEAIDECIKEKVDFILIAGDLFNTALPSIDGIKAVIRKLKHAKEKNIPVYYIAGSHDYSPSGKTMLDIIEEAELGVNVTKGRILEDGKLQLIFTHDKKTRAKITGMIGKAGQLDRIFYENLDKSNLESEKGFKIFLFHTTIDELKPEDMKEIESTPASFLPKGFDYYAGGHVHIVNHKSVEGYKNLVYPGPLFPANFSEMEKLGCGGFNIFEDGKIIRKKIEVKKSLTINVDVDKLSSEQASAKIIKNLEQLDVKDKIVLIRVHGNLSSGKPSDINFKSMFDELYEKGAFFIMKNSSNLSGDFFEKISVEHSSSDEIEEKIIKEHLGQFEHDFSDELATIKSLMSSFSEEKHEGEKVSDYDSRIKNNADLLLNIN